jgi:hypothetical protein
VPGGEACKKLSRYWPEGTTGAAQSRNNSSAAGGKHKGQRRQGRDRRQGRRATSRLVGAVPCSGDLGAVVLRCVAVRCGVSPTIIIILSLFLIAVCPQADGEISSHGQAARADVANHNGHWICSNKFPSEDDNPQLPDSHTGLAARISRTQGPHSTWPGLSCKFVMPEISLGLVLPLTGNTCPRRAISLQGQSLSQMKAHVTNQPTTPSTEMTGPSDGHGNSERKVPEAKRRLNGGVEREAGNLREISQLS